MPPSLRQYCYDDPSIRPGSRRDVLFTSRHLYGKSFHRERRPWWNYTATGVHSVNKQSRWKATRFQVTEVTPAKMEFLVPEQPQVSQTHPFDLEDPVTEDALALLACCNNYEDPVPWEWDWDRYDIRAKPTPPIPRWSRFDQRSCSVSQIRQSSAEDAADAEQRNFVWSIPVRAWLNRWRPTTCKFQAESIDGLDKWFQVRHDGRGGEAVSSSSSSSSDAWRTTHKALRTVRHQLRSADTTTQDQVAQPQQTDDIGAGLVMPVSSISVAKGKASAFRHCVKRDPCHNYRSNKGQRKQSTRSGKKVTLCGGNRIVLQSQHHTKERVGGRSSLPTNLDRVRQEQQLVETVYGPNRGLACAAF